MPGTAGPPWSKRGAGPEWVWQGACCSQYHSMYFSFWCWRFSYSSQLFFIVWSFALFGTHININQESNCHYNLSELSTDYLSFFWPIILEINFVVSQDIIVMVSNYVTVFLFFHHILSICLDIYIESLPHKDTVTQSNSFTVVSQNKATIIWYYILYVRVNTS